MGRPISTTRKVQRMGAKGREYVQNTMRFPPGLYEQLRDSAVAAGRTMNAEVVFRLQQSMGDAALAELTDGKRPSDEIGAGASSGIADDIAAIRALLKRLVERGAF